MKKRIRYLTPLVLAALLCGMLAAFAAEGDTHACMAGDKTIENVVEPTCMKEGSYQEVIRCKICNEIISSKTVTVKKSTAHTWDGGTVVRPVTRTEEGEMTFRCLVEGCTATKTDAIPVNPFLLGDVDADGRITAEDARLALRFSVGLGERDGVVAADQADDSFRAADFDHNGAVDSADARAILRVSVGLAP